MLGDSAVSICNSVLVKLGFKPLINLSETNERARVCNQLYPEVLREVLAAHAWNFSTGRQRLSQLAEIPPSEFMTYYELSNDYARINAVSHAQNDEVLYAWRVEADSHKKPVLATMVKPGVPVVVRYTRNVSDPAIWPADFTACMKALLESYLAFPMRSSQTLQEQAYGRYKELLDGAKGKDVSEGDSAAYMDAQAPWWQYSLLTARYH